MELSLLISREVKEGLVLARLEVAIVGTDDAVGIIDGNGPDVGQSLDLGRARLVVLIGHLDVELLGTRLDGVPARQTRGKVDIAGHAEVSGVDDLVGAGVVQDSLGVNTGLVGEGTETGDVVVEGNVDLNSFGNEVLDVLDLLQLVLALDVLGVGNHHAGHETTQGGDAVALTDTKDGGVNVGGTSLQGTVGVGNGATGVIVEVSLDVATHDTSQHTDELVDLAGRGTANGIGNTDTVDTNLVDGGVDGQEVDEIRAERVFARESDLDALGLDVFDDFNGGVLDVGHVLSVRVLTEVRGGSNDDITRNGRLSTIASTEIKRARLHLHSVNSRLDGHTGIVHVAPNVSKDLQTHGLESVTHGVPWDFKRTLDFRPSLQMASQSSLDCSEAQGLVSSI